MRWRWRIAIVVAAVAVVWVLGGVLRAGPAAQTWFARQHGSGATLENVRVDGVSPAIPPLWKVTIGGDVVEAGKSSPSYRSHMVVLIEPFTGWVITQSSN